MGWAGGLNVTRTEGWAQSSPTGSMSRTSHTFEGSRKTKHDRLGPRLEPDPRFRLLAEQTRFRTRPDAQPDDKRANYRLIRIEAALAQQGAALPRVPGQELVLRGARRPHHSQALLTPSTSLLLRCVSPAGPVSPLGSSRGWTGLPLLQLASCFQAQSDGAGPPRADAGQESSQEKGRG